MSTFEVIRGPEGCCLALDDLRIAGPKPWGGGTVIYSWKTDEEYKAVSVDGYISLIHDILYEIQGCKDYECRTCEYDKCKFSVRMEEIGCMSDELKPCPFCDGEATLIAARQRGDGAYRPAACGCDKCGIWRYGEIDYGHDGFATEEDFKESMEQAVLKWNARRWAGGGSCGKGCSAEGSSGRR